MSEITTFLKNLVKAGLGTFKTDVASAASNASAAAASAASAATITGSGNGVFGATPVSSSGGFTGPLNGIVGGTTPAAGSFTTLSATALPFVDQVVTISQGAGTVGNINKIDFRDSAGSLAHIITTGSAYQTDHNKELKLGSNGSDIAVISSTGLAVTGSMSATTTIKPGSYTVATLPSASASGAGTIAFTTDNFTTAILGLGLTAAGSGSNKVMVYSDGTNWINF